MIRLYHWSGGISSIHAITSPVNWEVAPSFIITRESPLLQGVRTPHSLLFWRRDFKSRSSATVGMTVGSMTVGMNLGAVANLADFIWRKKSCNELSRVKLWVLLIISSNHLRGSEVNWSLRLYFWSRLVFGSIGCCPESPCGAKKVISIILKL